MSSKVRYLLFVTFLALAILACNLLIPTAPTSDPGAAYTAAAQTVAAAVNQTLLPTLTSPPSASFTPLPVVDTSTPLPTLSPTLFFTATSSIVTISVSVDTNCRVGPGKIYEYVGGLLVGQTAEVYGKDPGGGYWYIRLPENPNIFCWVTGQYATLSGNTGGLPIFTPPPTPTPVPDFEMSYAGMDSCVGWWLEFKLKNIGPFAFKSYSISVKDLKTNTLVTGSGDGFTNLGGCLTSETTLTLASGKSTILSAPAFAYNPDNDKIKATITLCTKTGLGGQCITHGLEFKP